MEQYYSTDSLEAFKTEDGILLEEKKKGPLKMMLVILGLSVLMLIAGFAISMFGGTIGLAMGPWLVWGAAILIVVIVITFVIRLAMNFDPKIIFNTKKYELHVRGKVIPFGDIESITHQEQTMMSKTMIIATVLVNGKKKSLFSSAIVATDPKGMANLITSLNDLVQKGKLSDAVVDDMAKK